MSPVMPNLLARAALLAPSFGELLAQEMTFTSCAALSAEDKWRDFRDELISLAKGEPAAAYTRDTN